MQSMCQRGMLLLLVFDFFSNLIVYLTNILSSMHSPWVSLTDVMIMSLNYENVGQAAVRWSQSMHLRNTEVRRSSSEHTERLHSINKYC